MNQPPEPNPSNNSDRPSLVNLVWRFVKRPSTLIVTGGILALGVVGYTGGRIWLKRNLPGILESQIGNFVQRPVEIDKISNLSWNQVTVDGITIPETDEDPDNITIDQIDIRYNFFPVLIGRPLTAEAKIVDLQVYLEEDAPGKWLELELPESTETEPREIPIRLDIGLELEKARIELQPQQNPESINITIDGRGRYQKQQQQEISYDFDTQIQGGNIKLQGETNLDSGASQIQLASQPLNLVPLVTLIPNNPLKLDQGNFQANLDAQIAPLAQIEQTRGQGQIQLQNIQGKLNQIPLLAQAQLIWEEQTINISRGQLQLGDLQGQLQGSIDWQQGYQLQLNLAQIDLEQVPQSLGIEIPIPLQGQLNSQVQVTGEINQPQIKGSLNNSTPIKVDRIAISQIDSQFQGNLENIQLEQLRILPSVGGKIELSGEIKTQLASGNRDWRQMPLGGKIETQLPVAKLVEAYYQLPENLAVEALNSIGVIQGKLGNPQGQMQWQLEPGQSEISGQGEILFAEKMLNLYNTNLNLLGGTTSLDARSDITAQTWSAQIQSNNLELNRLLPQAESLPKWQLRELQANYQGNYQLENLEQWQGRAQILLNSQPGQLQLDSRLAQGQLNNQIQAENLAISQQISLNQAQGQLNLPLEDLLQLNSNPNLNNLQGEINAQIQLPAQGQIDSNTQIENNQIQSQIRAQGIEILPLSEELGVELPLEIALDPLDAQIEVNGDLSQIIQPEPYLPLNLEEVAVELGETQLRTQGQLALGLKEQQPEIEQLNLDIDSQVNLGEIPLASILEQLEIPSQIRVAGQAQFQGQLQGQKLLSQPLAPGNLSLVGQMQLQDLQLNERKFEAQLQGPVTVIPAQELSVELRGNRDEISAQLEPCQGNNCILPYLPSSYALRQGQGEQAIIATGNREGIELVNRISNLPLNLLQFSPGEAYGLPGIVDGLVSAQVRVNLEDLGTTGEVKVVEPSLGHIQGKEISTEFGYNPGQQEAQLVESSLKFADTEYNLSAGINLETGAIQGKLDLNENEIADIWSTLQWSDLNDVLRLVSPPEYARAESVQAEAVGLPGAPIKSQINLLGSKIAGVRKSSSAIRQGQAPLQLDIRGKYGGEVIVGGTLKSPEVDVSFQGQDWQWRTKPPVLDVVPELGLIQESQQVVPIRSVLLTAALRNGVLQLEPLRVEIADTELQVTGSFSPEQEEGEFQVEDLSLDLISQFVSLPVDATGKIDVKGEIRGSLENPEVIGEIDVSETTWSGKPFLESLQGEFSYREHVGKFATTFPESIQVQASVPSPLGTETGVAALDVKLTQEIFPLLEVLSQGQLIWASGDGAVDLAARLPLDWSQPLDAQALIQALRVDGRVVLEQAAIANPILGSQVLLNGEIILEQQRVKIDSLTGDLADSKLLVSGVFPLINPINSGDPDAANPLKIDIQPGDINLEGLYEGEVDGEIILTGTGFAPVISGFVSVARGRVFIPESEEEPGRLLLAERWFGTQVDVEPPVKITLDNFQIITEDIDLSDFSVYKFNFGGNLTLNGEFTELQELEGDGEITLNRGEIVFFDTQFFLGPRYNSIITFRPDQGLLNPYLDIVMQTSVAEKPDEGRTSSSPNEVRDDLFRLRSSRIEVTIAIDGNANQVIPSLGRDPVLACRLRSNTEPLIPAEIFPGNTLSQLQTCISVAASSEAGQSNTGILDSQIVQITSDPVRPRGEIIELLAGQFIGVAESLQDKTGLELLQLGADQFLIGPLLRDTIFGVEQFVSRGGQRVGLDDLRVYPLLETVYSIDRRSSIRVSYDYFFTEGQVRYELGF